MNHRKRILRHSADTEATATARATAIPTIRDNRLESNVILRATRQGTSKICSSRCSYKSFNYDPNCNYTVLIEILIGNMSIIF